MGFQKVRALIRTTHNKVDRIPGITEGKNAQDFVVSDAQAAKLVEQGFVTSLGVAAEPAKTVPMYMQVGVESGEAQGVPTPVAAAVNSVVNPSVLRVGAGTLVIGDSITAFLTNVEGGNQIANSKIITNRSWAHKAMGLVGFCSRIIATKGGSGNTLAQIRARFIADALTIDSDDVWLQGGSNDVDSGRTAEQMFEDIRWMYKQCRSRGKRFLYVGTTALARNQGAARSEMAKLRHMCRRAMTDLAGFGYFELAVAGQDYGGSVAGTSYGNPVTVPVPATDADGTHVTPYGATLESMAFAAFLLMWYGNAQWNRPGINSNNGGNSYDDSNFIVNSLMAGTGGTVGAGCTGTAPDSMEVTRSGGITAAGSAVARTDKGPGRWWQLDISGATAAGDFIRAGTGYSAPNGSTALGAALVGKVVTPQVEVDVSVTNGYVTVLRHVLRLKTAGGAVLGTVIWGEQFRPTEYDYITAYKGVLQSQEIEVPAGTSICDHYVYIQTSVGAQVQVRLTGLEARADLVTPLVAASINQ